MASPVNKRAREDFPARYDSPVKTLATPLLVGLAAFAAAAEPQFQRKPPAAPNKRQKEQPVVGDPFALFKGTVFRRFVAEGDCMKVFLSDNAQYVSKFPSPMRKAHASAKDLINRSVNLWDRLKAIQFPVAEILNRSTAQEECRIIQEYMSIQYSAVDQNHPLFSQVVKIIRLAQENEICLDIKPSNFMVQDDRLIMIDWDPNPEDTFEETIRYAVNKMVVESAREELLRQLHN